MIPADRDKRIEEIREEVQSLRELGTCDADDPATCRRCEDMEASERDRRLLLAALDEERERAKRLRNETLELKEELEQERDRAMDAAEKAIAHANTLALTTELAQVRASSWQRKAETLAEEIRIREQSQIPVIPRAAQEQLDQMAGALKAISETNDSGPWIVVYRKAGGGYEGLQAIAREALRVFRENNQKEGAQ